MDPDMVRQQEEAEREAVALAKQKPGEAAPVAAAAILQSMAAGSQAFLAGFMREAKPAEPKQPPAEAAARASDDPRAATAPYAATPPRALPSKRQQRLAFSRLGRFFSFALAGIILGGGLGIMAANYMGLVAAQAQLVIYGIAAACAAACGVTSFFAGPRQI